MFDERESWPSESECGEIIVKRLLAGDRGHYGPLEHVQIVFNCGYFPHSVMQQARTHRVGISFDVQCLAGDTEVTFIKASGSLRKIKIADLYDIWENGEKAIRTRKIVGRNGEPPREYRRDAKKRIKKMSLRVLNEETENFQIGHVKNVMCSGVQPIYRLTLEDGKTLDCTANHRLLTDKGWHRMGDALGLMTDSRGNVVKMTKSISLMCNGQTVIEGKLYRNKEWLQSQIVKGFSTAHIARLSKCSVSTVKNWADRYGLSLNEQDSKFVKGQKPWNYNSNALYHPKSPGNKLVPHPIKIVNVEYLGEQITYDLEVEGKWHNFVANGLVVHNSFRYTGQQFLEVLDGKKELEDVFYLRPVGDYRDRQGKSYYYSPEQRETDLKWCFEAIQRYQKDMEAGLSEEHARGKLPFDYRQHFVVSFNLRSLLHFLDLRYKKDAQLEIQQLCDLMLPHLTAWVPDVAEWYKNTRLGKARLSP